jgi:hypothetical protein
MPGQQPLLNTGKEQLDGVRAMHGRVSHPETAESESESDNEDTAVSGEAPVELVSPVSQGTPGVNVQSSDFGSIYEKVELTSDSEPEYVV